MLENLIHRHTSSIVYSIIIYIFAFVNNIKEVE